MGFGSTHLFAIDNRFSPGTVRESSMAPHPANGRWWSTVLPVGRPTQQKKG